MKNRIFLFCLLAALAVSCVKDQQEVIQTITNEPEFYATIEESGNPDTRVFADDQFRVLWNADDRVSIFNRTTYNRQYRFTGADGANSGSFAKVPGDEFVTGNNLDYAYSVYPYNENTCISNDGEITVFLPAEQTYRENSFGLGANTMIAITDDDELVFKNLCGYFSVKLYGDKVAVSSITLKGNNNEYLAGKAAVVAATDAVPTLTFDTSVATKEITLTCATPVTIGTTAETATTFWFVIPPTTFSGGITLKVKLSTGQVFKKATTGSLEIQRNTLKRSSALKVIPPPMPDAVDLGLSVKWASFNLGASAPEEYGDYYAWGIIEPYYISLDPLTWRTGKTGYNWASYNWCNGDYNKLTKYCPSNKTDYWDGTGTPDGKTVLDPEDDAAHVNLGGSWRMPTAAEWTELMENCTWTWTTQNGVNGYLVTATNGNSIFLPAAGRLNKTDLGVVGSFGYYSSSSLDTDEPFSKWSVSFYSSNINCFSSSRYIGHSIRPVCPKE